MPIDERKFHNFVTSILPLYIATKLWNSCKTFPFSYLFEKLYCTHRNFDKQFYLNESRWQIKWNCIEFVASRKYFIAPLLLLVLSRIPIFWHSLRLHRIDIPFVDESVPFFSDFVKYFQSMTLVVQTLLLLALKPENRP